MRQSVDEILDQLKEKLMSMELEFCEIDKELVRAYRFVLNDQEIQVEHAWCKKTIRVNYFREVGDRIPYEWINLATAEELWEKLGI